MNSNNKKLNKVITIISLNYAPEDTAIGLYSTQMAEFLVDKGWEVQVIAGFPYYPQWKIAKEYKNKPNYLVEEINGVSVHRYKQFVPKDPSFLKRSLQIADFTIGNLFHLGKLKKSDVVLSIIPFTSSAWLGNRLAKKLNAKHWVHIQDFEFDAAFESGLTSKKGLMKFIASALFKLEKSILDKADLVSTISNGMIRQLEAKTKCPNYFFPNWVDESFINPNSFNEHSFFDSEKFNVLYSGNIGGKQDWDLFVKVVRGLQDESNIQFVVVGDGATKDKLVEELQGFSTVKFYDPVPYDRLNDLLCSADLHVLFQKIEVVDTVMPSKILGMMCSQKPSIVTGNKLSEVANVFIDSTGGRYLYENSEDEIIEAIIHYKHDKEARFNEGSSARKYVIQKFSKGKVLLGLNDKLKTLIN